MRTPQFLINLRHQLHRRPETAGEEKNTAGLLRRHFLEHHPDFHIQEGIGGHGMLISKYYGPGAEFALRAELDGLPILETGTPPHRSEVEGKGHLCGHDGHMTILLDTVRKVEDSKPRRGALHLLFQPAEETGQGAEAMLDSGRLDSFNPDVIYALHNIPGKPLGQVLGTDGTFACGSVGVKLDIQGKTAHAAHPEDAVNPLILAVTALDETLSLTIKKRVKGFALATPVGLISGDENFGTSPADARLMVTLRAAKAEDLKYMMEETEKIARNINGQPGAKCRCGFVDYFPITKNPGLTDQVKAACQRANTDFTLMETPFRWSEDFGRFQENFRAYMFGIGSGEDQPALHAPDYDFPDALIDVGSSVFFELFKLHTEG